jgi:hypothetical protein
MHVSSPCPTAQTNGVPALQLTAVWVPDEGSEDRLDRITLELVMIKDRHLIHATEPVYELADGIGIEVNAREPCAYGLRFRLVG